MFQWYWSGAIVKNRLWRCDGHKTYSVAIGIIQVKNYDSVEKSGNCVDGKRLIHFESALARFVNELNVRDRGKQQIKDNSPRCLDLATNNIGFPSTNIEKI